MPQYVIEREIPGAGNLSEQELHDISAKSNGVLAGMDGRATWLHSYVTGDKIYCVYEGADEAAIREHAELGGFPANSVSAVATVISPATGH
jgi:hypothetical protein